MNSTQITIPFIKKTRVRSLPVYLLFLVWPFALLTASLRNFRDPNAKRGFILFCVYFGFVFVFSRDIQGADSARYAQNLVDLHGFAPSLLTLWNSFYSFDTNLLDIYQPVTTWLVSLFTDNAHFLFAIFSFVFGYFYAQNIWIILNNISGKKSIIVWIYILLFILIIPLWYINGVRMYTAAQIFIYGVFLYLLGNNRKGLIWSSASLLFHFSFLLPVAILFLYSILPRKLPIYFLFFIVTAFIAEIDLFTIRNYLSFLPDIFQPRVIAYTNSDYAIGVNEAYKDTVWYVRYAEPALRLTIYSLLSVLVVSRSKIFSKDPLLFSLICFALFFYGWSNLAAHMPSGARFQTVANFLSVAALLLFFIKYKSSIALKLLRFISLPVILYYCIVSIRIGFDFIGLSTFIGNPFTAFLFEDKIPIIEIIKSLLG